MCCLQSQTHQICLESPGERGRDDFDGLCTPGSDIFVWVARADGANNRRISSHFEVASALCHASFGCQQPKLKTITFFTMESLHLCFYSINSRVRLILYKVANLSFTISLISVNSCFANKVSLLLKDPFSSLNFLCKTP